MTGERGTGPDQLFGFVSRVYEALADLGPQLGVNVLFVSFATAAVIWAGYNLAMIFRLLSPSDSDTRSRCDDVLVGYLCGALYCLVIMYALGAIALFSTAAVWAALILPGAFRAVAIANRHQRVMHRWPAKRLSIKSSSLLFAALSFGPLLVSLTCPVPAWMDVLETNAAPVQRILTFSSFSAGNSLPSALYSTDRATPLFTAFHAVVASCFRLTATETLAAGLVPSLLLTLLAASRVGRMVSPNAQAGAAMAVACWVLTFSYVHVQDARSTVWHFCFTLVALWQVLELRKSGYQTSTAVGAGLALAAAVLAHPLEGLFTVCASVLLLFLSSLPWAVRLRRGLVVFLTGITFAGPLLWVWWPANTVALIAGVTAAALAPLLIAWAIPIANQAPASTHGLAPGDSARLIRAVGYAMLLTWLSTFFLPVDYPGPDDRAASAYLFFRYPVTSVLAVALAILGFRGKLTSAFLIMAVGTMTAILPLWVLRLSSVEPLTAASLGYELPLKGLDFWLSGILAVAGSAVLSLVWFWNWKRVRGRVLVVAALVLPFTHASRPKEIASQPGPGFASTLSGHLRLAAYGYFRGWPDPRFMVGRPERELFSFLDNEVNEGRLTDEDWIDHVAPATSSSRATPFPAFTGIAQRLYLADVDTSDFHTADGAIFDIHTSGPTSKWLLVERSMLPQFYVDSALAVVKNERLLLLKMTDS